MSAVPPAAALQDGKGRLRKIEGWVSFPFVLDIGAFCEPADDAGPQRSARYQLLGVVEHRGESLRRAANAKRCPMRHRSHDLASARLCTVLRL